MSYSRVVQEKYQEKEEIGQAIEQDLIDDEALIP